MVSEADTRRCANKEVVPRRGKTRGSMPRTLGPEGGWIWWSPTSIGERNECQRGRWALKGGGLDISH